MTETSDRSADDTIEERLPGSRLKFWLLLDAGRWYLAGLVLVTLFVAILAVGWLDPGAFSDDVIAPVFEPLLGAVITSVTIVVTINQLVLSQELGAAGDQRERMSGAISFRKEVESALDTPVTPPDPGPFLAAIIAESSEHAGNLLESIDGEGEVADRIRTFASEIQENAESTQPRLEDAEFGSFEVIDAALDYNYSRKLYEARRIEQESGDQLSGTTLEALEEIMEMLELYGVTREHFKTLYFQWELIDLSRSVLYAAVPALFVSASMLLFVDSGTIPGTTAGIETVLWVIAGAFAVAVLPFVLLLIYVVRIVTIAKRTLAIGPFVLRTTDKDSEGDSLFSNR